MYQAQTVHRAHHAAGEVQLCTLLSIKTGGCPEDCGYCSQSKSADSGVKATKLMDPRAVLQMAAQAKDAGSQRFCMGAAWRNPKDRDMPAILEMVKGVRQMGLETCMTLGMLTPGQAAMLADAGLDYYNHNIDTSPERYDQVIEFVRTVAVARITMPLSMVRLSAGRESMSEATQALCFMAGANSIFTGEKLLTTGNRGDSADAALFAKLGVRPMTADEPMRVAAA